MAFPKLTADALGGVVLLLAAVAALIIDNSALAPLYDQLLSEKLTVGFQSANISKPLVLWINDGLMAIFFLYVGLEVKRELMVGKLSSWNQASLPLFGAIGGMAIPALIYVGVIFGTGAASTSPALNGWAIPAATDIAFAIGLLALFAAKAPPSAKIFLLALAIFDDIGAIVIIAVFYSSQLSLVGLAVAAAAIVAAFFVNRIGEKTFAPYMFLFMIAWVAMLKSGVHATLAGVLIAMAIPLKDRHGQPALLEQLEHDLKDWVIFVIMPIFAFANSGIPISSFGLENLFSPISLAVAAGLFLGKPIGIIGMVWLAETLGLAKRDEVLSWSLLLPLSYLAGIGFTMSLFIGGLAFEGDANTNAVRAGVMVGSLMSALAALVAFQFWRAKKA